MREAYRRRRVPLLLETLEPRWMLSGNPPTVTNDTYQVVHDCTLYALGGTDPAGVLANDTSPDGATLAVAAYTEPTRGTLLMNTDGTFLYTPQAGYVGSDNFTYTASDNGALATATVTIDITDEPPVTQNATFQVLHDQTLGGVAEGSTPPNVLVSDTDPDGDALTVVSYTEPAHGTLNLQPSGAFTYTPQSGFLGSDQFTYVVSDGADTAEGTVTLNVIGQAPAAPALTYQVPSGQPLVADGSTGDPPTLLASASDPDNDQLTVIGYTEPTHGTLTVQPDGSFTYTAQPWYTGTDNFTYTISNGALSTTATVTLNDTASLEVNLPSDPDAPAPLVNPVSYQILHDQTLEATGRDGQPRGVLAVGADPNGQTLSVVQYTEPSHGALLMNADGTFDYTPQPGYVGPDRFTYTASDGTNTATAVVTITVTDQPPVAFNDSYQILHDQTLSADGTGGDPPGVLSKDYDPDGDALVVVANSEPAHGSLVMNPDGTFTYTPPPGYIGPDSFTYTVSDGADTAAATVNLLVTDQPPIAHGYSYQVPHDQTFAAMGNAGGPASLLTDDSDPDGDPLFVVANTEAVHGALTVNADGTFTYTPQPGYVGPDSFTYTVSDSAETASATVNLEVIGQPPEVPSVSYQAFSDSTLTASGLTGQPATLLAGAYDPEGAVLSVVANTQPSDGSVTVNPNGSFTYIPDASFAGTDDFTFTVSDGAYTVTATVTLNVSAEGPTPGVYQMLHDQTLNADGSYGHPPGLLTETTDAEGNPLTVTVATGPTGGTLVLSTGGTFLYTPNAGFVGTDGFTYNIIDGTDTTTSSATISVTDQAPQARNDSYQLLHDQTLNATGTNGNPNGLLLLTSDPDGDPLFVVGNSDPQHGTLSVNPDGTFVYTPQAGYVGTDDFTYTVSDGAESATATITLDITDQAPVANPATYQVLHDQSLYAVGGSLPPTLLANATDPDGDPLTVVAYTEPTHGTLEMNPDGSFIYTPLPGFVGTDHFTYTISDGADTAASAVTINVTDQAPSAVNASYQVLHDYVLNANGIGGNLPTLLANDSDADGDVLTVVSYTEPVHGTINVMNPDGSFVYTPEAGYVGTDEFTYTVSDGAAMATGTVYLNVTNQAPVANPSTYQVYDNETLTANGKEGNPPTLVADDYDLDGDSLSVVGYTEPAHGALTVNLDGSFTYIPQTGFAGFDGFSYTVSNGASEATSTVILVVSASPNDQGGPSYTSSLDSGPIVYDQSYVILHDQVLTANGTDGNPATLLANASDPGGYPLSVMAYTEPSHGSLLVAGSGSFTYTPQPGYVGPDSFTYTVGDGTDTASAVVTIAVTDQPPVASDAHYQILHDQTLTADGAPGDPPSVLSYDADPDGDVLFVVGNTEPAHGSLVMNLDGTFTYTPQPGFVGTDAFTYTLSDGAETATGIVAIDVTDQPPVVTDATYQVLHDQTLYALGGDRPSGVLANASDPDGDPLFVTSTTESAHGLLVMNPDGTFTYTPESGYVGSDSFEYTVSDGAETATGTVTIDVTDQPPVIQHQTYQVVSGQVLNADGINGHPATLLVNASDPDHDPLFVVANTEPTNGTVEVAADGSFVYVPETGYIGTDSFDYSVSDGANTVTATVTIDVIAQAPATGTYQLLHDQTLTANGTDGNPAALLIEDTDSNGDVLTVTVATAPAHGTLVLDPDGNFQYTPAAGFIGTDSFTYTINGSATPTTGMAIIEVTDQSPQVTDETYQLLHDQTLTATGVDGHPAGVLAQDADPDGDALTVIANTAPAHGKLVMNPDGTFEYTPNAGYIGMDEFTYTVSDGAETATATVTIDITDQAPIANPVTYRVLHDQNLYAFGGSLPPTLLANATDADGDPLTVVAYTEPTHGALQEMNSDGSFLYTPLPGYVGIDNFSYTISDGADTATGEVFLDVTDQAPVANPETYQVLSNHPLVAFGGGRPAGVLAADSDPDGDALTLVHTTQPAHGSLVMNADGTFTYTPNAGFVGLDSFTYTISDGVLSATATVALDVNDPAPYLRDDTPIIYQVVHGRTLSATGESDESPTLLANIADPSGGPLTVVSYTETAHGTLVMNPDGSFTYTSQVSFVGTDSFYFTVSDGAETVTVMATIDVTDQAPVAPDESYQVFQGEVLSSSNWWDDYPNLLTAASDPDNDTLTVVNYSEPSYGALTVSPDGSFTYAPQSGYTGSDEFTYTISDGALQATGTVTINVEVPTDGSLPQPPSGSDSAAPAPIAHDLSYQVVHDQILEAMGTGGRPLGVLATDIDPNGEPLTVVGYTGPAHGALDINPDGTFIYTPHPGYVGPDSFTYTISDGYAAATATATVSLDVTDQPPTPADDTYYVLHDTTLVARGGSLPPGVLANDTDADGDPLTVVAYTEPTYGALDMNADGTFTYAPQAGFVGTDGFTYTVSDGADTASATVTIEVTDQPPVTTPASYQILYGENLVADGQKGHPQSLQVDASDPDGDALTFVVAAEPAYGALALDRDGSFTYKPEAGFVGTDQFTYDVSDGAEETTGVVTITIVDPTPVAPDVTYTLLHDQILVADGQVGDQPALSATDGNPDVALMFSTASEPAHGTLTLQADGSFTYTPQPGYVGPDSFDYTVSDGVQQATGMVTLEVTDQPPVAQNLTYQVLHDQSLSTGQEGQPPTLLATVIDPDGDSLFVVSNSNPANGTVQVNADGSFVYTPDAGFVGTDHFTYTIGDGAETASATVTIDVIDEPPVAVDANYQVLHDKTLAAEGGALPPGVLVNDSGYDAAPLEVIANTQPADGVVAMNPDGTFTYTPQPGYVGADNFTYTASDGADTATATVTIDVTDQPPVANNVNYQVLHDQVLLATGADGNPLSVLTADSDPDGDSLQVLANSQPGHGTVTMNPNGTFEYTPPAGYVGPDSFTYTISDGADTAAATVNISVTGQPPVVTNVTYQVDTGLTLQANGLPGQPPTLLASAHDPDGDPLTVVANSEPSAGTLTLNTDGSFTYTPQAGFVGTDSFSYTVSDGAETAAAIAILNVTEQAPTPGFYQMLHDQVLVANDSAGNPADLLASPTDAQGVPLTVTLATGPADGTLVLNSDGTFQYTPGAGFVGTDSFSYVVAEGPYTTTNTATIEVTDQAPVAQNASYQIPNDETLYAKGDGQLPTLLANDYDPDGDPLFVVAVSQPAHGTIVSIDADGSFAYTPQAGYVGPDSFTYTISDGADTATATVFLAVSGTTIAAPNETYTILHDQTLSADGQDGDAPSLLTQTPDLQGNPLTIVANTEAAHGIVVVNADGTFTYTPQPGYVGSDEFTYTLSNGSDTATGTVTLEVTDQAPVANSDTYQVLHDQTLVAGDGQLAPSVLANDTDADGDPLTVVGNSEPSHGTLAMNPDGSFIYAPQAGYVGSDRFTYTISDGADTATGIVTIEVTDQPPVAEDATYQVLHDTVLSVPGEEGQPASLLASDADPDGDPIWVVNYSEPAHGTLATVNPDGSFVYVPESGYVGVDAFTYTISDGAETASAIVTLDVTDQPPVALDASYMVQNGESLDANSRGGNPPSVLADDYDPDGDAIAVVANSEPAHGSLTMKADGTFIYTPEAGYVGLDGFTYTISDGVTTASATVQIEVTDPAPVANAQTYAMLHDQTLTANGTDGHPRGLLAGDADPSGNPLTVVDYSEPAYGTVVVNPDGTFAYTPQPGYVGTDAFTYTISDGTENATATVTLDVADQPPVAHDLTYQVLHDQTLDASGWQAGGYPQTLLTTASDPDDDSLTVVANTQTAHGSLDVNSDGSFTYTPLPGYVGSDSFTYTISDGAETATATVTIDVFADPPVVPDSVYQVQYGQTLVAGNGSDSPGLLVGAYDPDGDPLTIVSHTNPANGTLQLNADGAFSYTPQPAFVGTDSFTFEVSDGGASMLATAVIDVVNQAPVAYDVTYQVHQGQTLNADGYGDAPPTLLAYASDPDGDPLTVVSYTETVSGELVVNPNGSFTYTPLPGFVGTDRFTFTVSDGADTASGVAAIQVVDQAPIANNDSYTVVHGRTLAAVGGNVPTLLANDSDPDGDPLHVVAYTEPAHGTLTVQPNGSFTYTSQLSFVGQDTFSYTISDGAETATATAAIQVTDYAPIAQNDSFTVVHDRTLSPMASVLVNDSDPDGDALQVVTYTKPANGALTMSPNGFFTYTPQAGYHGTDTFSYTISDGAETAAATVTIQVTEQAPTAANLTYNVPFDQTYNSIPPTLLSAANNPDGGPLTITAYTEPTHGALFLNANGSFSYTPQFWYSGSDSFTYTISNGIAQSTGTVTLNIAAPPSLSMTSSATTTFTVGQLSSFTVTTNGSPVATLTEQGTLPAGISFMGSSNGTAVLTGTPQAGSNGTYAVTFTASNGVAPNATQNFMLVVQPSGNESPTLSITSSASTTFTVGQLSSFTVTTSGSPAAMLTEQGTLPAGISFMGSSNGTAVLTGTPQAGTNGTYAIAFTASNGVAPNATQNFMLVVQPASGDNSPTITSVNETMFNEGQENSFTVTSSGAPAATLTEDGTLPSGVTFTNNGNGTATLAGTPPTDSNDSYALTFTVNSGGAPVAAQSFTLFISPPGDDTFTANSATPSFGSVTPDSEPGDLDAASYSYTILHDQTLDADGQDADSPNPGLFVNDTTPNGDAPTLVSYTETTHGALLVNLDGTFTYTPQPGYVGPDAFNYTISAGSDTATGSVSIQVTDHPPVAAPATYQLLHDRTFTADGVGDDSPTLLAYASDPDPQDHLRVVAFTQPLHGALAVSSNGAFTYTPLPGYVGSDRFTYTVGDGALTNTGSVSLLVTDTPPVTSNAHYQVHQGQMLDASLLAYAYDADGDPLTVVAYSQATHGALTVYANGTFTYTPQPGYVGADGFSYTLSDGAATVSGYANLSVTDTAPVADNASYQTAAAQTLEAGADEDEAPSLLAYAHDADGDELSIVAYTETTHGALNVQANGSFTYTPQSGFVGTDTFSYTVRDGAETATGSVTITVVSYLPEAVPQSYTLLHDQPLVAGPDEEAPSLLEAVYATEQTDDPVTIAAHTQPAHGTLVLDTDGDFTYTPQPGFVGNDSFLYTISDGTGLYSTGPVTLVVTDQAPVAGPASYSVAYGQTLDVAGDTGLLAQASDPDGDTLFIQTYTTPAHGSLVVDTDGSFMYTAQPGFLGDDTFSYTVSDGAETATGEVTITVTDQGPTAADQAFTVPHEQTLTGTLLGGASDPAGVPLTVVAWTQPAYGSLSVSADGTFVYTPQTSFVGTDGFDYTLSDGALTDSATVMIDVTDQPPVAADYQYTVLHDQPLTTTAGAESLLSNASDPDGDPLTVVSYTQPQYGTLRVHPDGSFTYMPQGGYVGADEFTYTIGDGVATATGEVTINVTDRAPVAGNDFYTVLHDQPLVAGTNNSVPPGLLANASDADGDPLAVIANTDPAHGFVVVNPDGSFVYESQPGYVGLDRFTFTVTDGAEDATGTVTIQVTDTAPVLGNPSYTLLHDQVLLADGVGGDSPTLLASASAADGDTLYVVSNGEAAHGTVEVNSDGSFLYTPQAGYVGPDSFSYVVSDGAETVAGIATIEVTDHAPAAPNETYQVLHDQVLVADGISNDSPTLLASATDADGDTLYVVANSEPVHGLLQVNADGSFAYEPLPGFVGIDSFTYTISDGAEEATGTVTIDVTDHAPVAGYMTYQLSQDQALNVSAAAGVLSTATDADGDPLYASLVMDAGPSHGSLTFNSDGSFGYLPNPGYSGTDSFQFTVSDGALTTGPLTVTLTVEAALPPASAATYSVNLTQPTSIGAADGLLANDAESLTAELVSGPAYGSLTLNSDGSFTYTPDSEFAGSDSFSYRVSDGVDLSATQTVTLTAAALAANDTFALAHDTELVVSAAAGLTSNAKNANGTSLQAMLVTGPQDGTLTLNADGSFTYTPNVHFVGTDSFTYTLTNSFGTSTSATVTLAVVNTAPVAGNDTYSVAYDQTLSVNTFDGVLSTASDAEGDALTATLVAGPAHGTLSLNANGSFSYTPDAGYTGSDSLQFTVSDGLANSSTATVTLQVSANSPDLGTGGFNMQAVDMALDTTLSAWPLSSSNGNTSTTIQPPLDTATPLAMDQRLQFLQGREATLESTLEAMPAQFKALAIQGDMELQEFFTLNPAPTTGSSSGGQAKLPVLENMLNTPAAQAKAVNRPALLLPTDKAKESLLGTDDLQLVAYKDDKPKDDKPKPEATLKWGTETFDVYFGASDGLFVMMLIPQGKPTLGGDIEKNGWILIPIAAPNGNPEQRYKHVVTKSDGKSITIDVFGDGKKVVTLTDTIVEDKEKFPGYAADKHVITGGFFKFGTTIYVRKQQVDGPAQPATNPVMAPSDISTADLEALVLARLEKLEKKVPSIRESAAAFHKRVAQLEGSDESELRLQLIDVNEVLAEVEQTLPGLDKTEQKYDSMSKEVKKKIEEIQNSDKYKDRKNLQEHAAAKQQLEDNEQLLEMADTIRANVKDVRGVYIKALKVALEQSDTPGAFDLSQVNAKAQQLTNLILGLDVEVVVLQQIEEIIGARAAINTMRLGDKDQVKGHEKSELRMGGFFGGTNTRRPSVEKELMDLRQQILNDLEAGKTEAAAAKIASLTIQLKRAQATMYALALAEQIKRYEDRGGVGPFFKGTAQGYNKELKEILDLFDAGKADEAIERFATFLHEPKFQENLEWLTGQAKWVGGIKDFAKVLAITVVAALAAGATGGAVAPEMALLVEAAVFTVVSRTGQQFVFGKVDGDFATDFAMNLAVLGVLRVVGGAYATALKSSIGKDITALKGLSKAFAKGGEMAAGVVTLEIIEELRSRAAGKERDLKDIALSFVKNLVMIGAIEGGRLAVAKTAGLLDEASLKLEKGAALKEARADLDSALKQLDKNAKEGKASLADESAYLEKLKKYLQTWEQFVQANKGKLTDKQQQDHKAAMDAVQAAMELPLVLADLPNAGIFFQKVPGAKLSGDVIEFGGKPESLRDIIEGLGGTLDAVKGKDGLYMADVNGRTIFFKTSSFAPAKTATAFEMAKTVAEQDAVAKKGLEKLEGTGASQTKVNQVLASVPDGQMKAFLRLLADPNVPVGPSSLPFLDWLAKNPKAVEFANKYGPELFKALKDQFWRLDKLTEALEAADKLLESLPVGDRAAKIKELIEATDKPRAQALGLFVAPVKKVKPATFKKDELGVNRQTEMWKQAEKRAKKLQKDHPGMLTDEQVKKIADLLQIIDLATRGYYDKFSDEDKLELIDWWDEQAEKAGMIQQWINGFRGNVLAEALFGPTAQRGKPKATLKNGDRVDTNTKGATVPDYYNQRTGYIEWVNLKSDRIVPKDRGEISPEGVAAAKKYLKDAKAPAGEPGSAANLPKGDKYSLDFIRDPGKATRDAMLEILFADGSPIDRVKFGDKWYDRTNWKGGK